MSNAKPRRTQRVALDTFYFSHCVCPAKLLERSENVRRFTRMLRLCIKAFMKLFLSVFIGAISGLISFFSVCSAV